MPKPTYPPLAQALLPLLLSAPILADGPPDPGKILQDIQKQTQPVEPTAKPIQALPETRLDANDLGRKITVAGFRIEGAQLFSNGLLGQILQPMVGQTLSLPELMRGTHAITRYYAQQGIVAQAYLPEQEVLQGIILIKVVESRFSGAKVDNQAGVKLADQQVVAMVNAAQAPGQVVRLAKLDRGLLLINDLAGVAASAILGPGEQAGESSQQISLEARPRFDGSLALDNAGTRSVGEWRSNASLNFNNPAGRGDQLNLRILGMHNGDRLNPYLRAAYTLPLGAHGFKLTGSAAWLNYRLGQPFSSLDSKGNSQTWRMDGRYPLIRSVARNFYLNGYAEHKRLHSTLLGLALNDRKINSAGLGMQVHINGNGQETGLDLQWGLSQISPQNGNANPKQRTSRLNISLQHQRSLAKAWSWRSHFEWQASTDNLDPAEEVGLGGMFGVRAYPASEGSGDNGGVLSNELWYGWNERWRLGAFLDLGHVQSEAASTTGYAASTRTSLKGSGLSLEANLYKNTSLKALLAWRIGKNPHPSSDGKDSDGRKRNPRLWLSLNHSF